LFPSNGKEQIEKRTISKLRDQPIINLENISCNLGFMMSCSCSESKPETFYEDKYYNEGTGI
jgi:hypothetical protein